MRLSVLGTGSADGWPNPHCGCGSCVAARTEGSLRGQTSALLDGVLLLDCGPETPHAAQRAGLDLTRLRHVLLTHVHPDHCAPAFLLFRSWVRDGARDAPLDVLGPSEVVEQARQWVAPDSPVRFTEVRAGDRHRLEQYDVRVLGARHGGKDATVLYDVSGPGGRVLYATDTGPLPERTVEAVRAAAFDVVLLEETFGDHTAHGTDHLDLATFPEQLRRLREVGAVTPDTDVLAVHLSHRNPPTAELGRRLSDWGARVVADGTSVGERPVAAVPAVPARPSGRTLVLGGARSGKSREAERLLAAHGAVTYVATGYPVAPHADAGPDPGHLGHLGRGPDHGLDTSARASAPQPGARPDAEWARKVRRHRERRPAGWSTVETLDLVPLLEARGGPLLVDCLTLWLTRVMDAHDAWDDEAWASFAAKAVRAEVDALVEAWRATSRRVVAVSNEVGQGVVPDSSSGRRFRDAMGELNARLAAETEDVRWCVAGRVVPL